MGSGVYTAGRIDGLLVDVTSGNLILMTGFLARRRSA